MPGFAALGCSPCRHTSYLTNSIKVRIRQNRNVIVPIFDGRSERGPFMNVLTIQAIYV